MEAAGRSKQMVGNAGWWWTFGMVILLGLASLAAFVVILLDRLGLLQDERVRGDRQRHPAVPAVRGPLPALRDLLRQRAVHRLRRGHGPGAGRRRAARHPAGSAGSSGVRHAGLAHRRRAGPGGLRRRRRSAAARRRRRLEGRGGPARGAGAPASAARGAGFAAGARPSRPATPLRSRRPPRMPVRLPRRNLPRHRRRPDRWAEPGAPLGVATPRAASTHAGMPDCRRLSTILTKESAHGWARPSDTSLGERGWKAEAPPTDVCSHVRREAVRREPGGGGRRRPAGEAPAGRRHVRVCGPRRHSAIEK